jgi:hypothetical protein
MERGEPRWIAACRGFLGVVVMLGVAIFGVFAIVLNPVSEMGTIPTRDLRGLVLTPAFYTPTPITWGVILVSNIPPQNGNCVTFYFLA